MPNILQKVDALFNGVSRQSPTIRRPNQVQEASNILFSVTKMAEKRPPTRYIGELRNSVYQDGDDIKVHFIDRDQFERYMVIAGIRGIEVYDTTTGQKMTVEYQDAQVSEICRNTTGKNIKMITSGDTTLYVNKEIEVETIPVVLADNFNYSFAIPEGDGGDLVNTYSSPIDFPSSPTDNKFYFADGDYPYRKADPNLENFLKKGYYKGNSNADEFRKHTDDAFRYERRWVDFASDLPTKFNCSKWATGTPSYMETPCYIEVKELSAGRPEGWYKGTAIDSDVNGVADASSTFTWERVPPPNVADCYLDPYTMPLKIERISGDDTNTGTGDIKFVVSVCDWKPRLSGDTKTNPAPSFVGKTINDIAFFNDRLVIAAGVNIVLSASGDFFDFFIESVKQIVDSDPIDISAAVDQVTDIFAILPFERSLMCFGRGGRQFELRSIDGPLSPLNVELIPTTSYEVSEKTEPEVIGKSIYFVSDRGIEPVVYEYYYALGGNVAVPNGFKITEHVKGYISGGTSYIFGSDENGIIGLLNPSEPETITVYRYHWEGQEKLQSAWSKWKLQTGTKIISATVYDDDIVLLICQKHFFDNTVVYDKLDNTVDPEGTDTSTTVLRLVRIAIKNIQPVNDLPYDPHLDSRVFLDPNEPRDAGYFSYNQDLNETLITFPFFDPTVFRSFNYSWIGLISEGTEAGQIIRPKKITGNPILQTTSLLFEGKYNEKALFLGLQYPASIELSKPFVYDRNGSAIDIPTVVIRDINISHTDTGTYNVIVVDKLNTSTVATFTSKSVGSPLNLTGGNLLDTGVFRRYVGRRPNACTIELSSYSHLPMNITGLEYNILYNERRRG